MTSRKEHEPSPTHPRLEALRKLQQSIAARGVDLAAWAREARTLRRDSFSASLGNRRTNVPDQHEKYWALFQEVLNTAGGPVSGNRKPARDNWMAYAVGRGGFELYAWRRRRPDLRVSASLYLQGEDAKAFFELLHREKETIESELRQPLHWRDDMSKEREIAIYLRDVDSNDESDWPRQHQWLARRLNELHAVFSLRIQRLNLDDLEPRAS